MADGVAITAGSGTTIATDDCGSPGHAQIVKLAYSTDGSASLIEADADGLKVKQVLALPAGTNAIGKLAANSGVDIGDVDVTSTVTPTNRTATGSITGNGQSVSLAVPGCSTATFQIVGTWTITIALEGSTDGGTTYVTIPRLVPDALGQAQTSSFTSSGSNNGVYLVPCGGYTHVRARSTAFTSGQADIAWAASLGSQATYVAGSIPAGTNNIGDVDVLTLPALPAGSNTIGKVDLQSGTGVTIGSGNGTATSALRVSIASDSTGQVKLAASDGTDIGSVDILSLPASTNTIEVVGDIAHDTGVGGNPVQIAGAAQDCDDTAPPNRVSAESDTTRLATDRDGAVFVRPHGPQVWSYHSDGSSALTDASVHSAPGSGLSLYVTDIIFSNGSSTAINIYFEEGSTKVLGPWYLEGVNGRGLHIKFATPKKITANTALTVTTSGAVAHCVDVTGFVAQG